jgi:transcription elongation factor GreB
VSKAFTRESDDDSEDPVPLLRPSLPAGVKNYITLRGAQRLRDELTELSEKKRRLPDSATSSDRPEPSQPGSERRKIESRISQLRQILDSVVVAEPPATGRDVVRFGAIVTVRHSDDGESIYRMVGVDETDFDQGRISWLSPLAKQLLGRRAGERVRFKTPSGEEELEILAVSYE